MNSEEQRQSISEEEHESGDLPLPENFVEYFCSMKLSHNSRALFEILDSRETIEGREPVIRELLIEAETNVELNDGQPMDNGD